MNAAFFSITSAANAAAELRPVEEQKAILRRQDRRHGCARRRVLDERADRFARVRSKRGNIDECRDLWIVAGLRDDDAAIRVADENRPAALRRDRALVTATSSASDRVGFWTIADVVAVLLQNL